MLGPAGMPVEQIVASVALQGSWKLQPQQEELTQLLHYSILVKEHLCME